MKEGGRWYIYPESTWGTQNHQTFPGVGVNRGVTESIPEEIMTQLRPEVRVRQGTKNGWLFQAEY